MIFALVDRYLVVVDGKFTSLNTIDRLSTDASRRIAAAMMEAHHAKPWMATIVAARLLQDNSPVMRALIKGRGTRRVQLNCDTVSNHAAIRFGALNVDPDA